MNLITFFNIPDCHCFLSVVYQVDMSVNVRKCTRLEQRLPGFFFVVVFSFNPSHSSHCLLFGGFSFHPCMIKWWFSCLYPSLADTSVLFSTGLSVHISTLKTEDAHSLPCVCFNSFASSLPRDQMKTLSSALSFFH